ncbi:hypothetical protein [Arthrobacter sp. S41]|uniref:hypothetical protein n=1 Tax=Arthrobacter sp. S41 TaxID=2509721 RepID=UPI0010359409|nr:hypothetical protein [Arthrobacter sp. S41]TAP26844.1 hypothetical protein EYR88_00290 [Arthrobacter sp. S41]
MTPKPVDGKYGERTALVAFLFNKSAKFHRGFEAGRTVHRDKLTRNLERIQANYLGGDYLLGFKFGKDVHKHGIKDAIRKAKA